MNQHGSGKRIKIKLPSKLNTVVNLLESSDIKKMESYNELIYHDLNTKIIIDGVEYTLYGINEDEFKKSTGKDNVLKINTDNVKNFYRRISGDIFEKNIRIYLEQYDYYNYKNFPIIMTDVPFEYFATTSTYNTICGTHIKELYEDDDSDLFNSSKITLQKSINKEEHFKEIIEDIFFISKKLNYVYLELLYSVSEIKIDILDQLEYINKYRINEWKVDEAFNFKILINLTKDIDYSKIIQDVLKWCELNPDLVVGFAIENCDINIIGKYKSELIKARDKGYIIVAKADISIGPKSIENIMIALKDCLPKRITHGFRIFEDEKLIQTIKDHNITLVMDPMYDLDIIAKMIIDKNRDRDTKRKLKEYDYKLIDTYKNVYENIKEMLKHPIKYLLDQGVNIIYISYLPNYFYSYSSSQKTFFFLTARECYVSNDDIYKMAKTCVFSINPFVNNKDEYPFLEKKEYNKGYVNYFNDKIKEYYDNQPEELRKLKKLDEIVKIKLDSDEYR